MNWLKWHKYAAGRVLRNAVFWLLFSFYHVSGREFSFKYYIVTLVVLLVSYGIPCYINNLILIPRYLQKRRFLLFTLLFIALLVVTTIESYYITHLANNNVQGLDYMGNLKDVRMPYHALPSLLMFTLLAAAKFTNDAFSTQRKLDLYEKEKLAGELESLKSQINPHFLFNALNTIYGLSMRNSGQTPSSILKLSDILRYVLYESDTPLMPVSKEIGFIEQYIEFAKLRQRPNVLFRSDLTHIEDEYNMAPLLLLPLVENAIKHGLDKTITDPWVDLRIHTKGSTLYFHCSNSNKPHKQETGGIGLRNVKRRLDLIYPGRHSLEILETEKQYDINLSIQLL